MTSWNVYSDCIPMEPLYCLWDHCAELSGLKYPLNFKVYLSSLADFLTLLFYTDVWSSKSWNRYPLNVWYYKLSQSCFSRYTFQFNAISWFIKYLPCEPSITIFAVITSPLSFVLFSMSNMQISYSFCYNCPVISIIWT